MGFVKVVKNKAYYKRFQVQFRRRREGKTNYKRRHALVVQDKNKYNTPKFRLIVRFTNKDIICQIARARVQGDEILAAAYAHELPKYGLSLGLTNYSAAYCTGLLIARRMLDKVGLADKYEGFTEIDGEDYELEELEDGPKPFKALLDVGLHRTTTGAKIFAAMKGSSDGGLDVPHGISRFVGYDDEEDFVDPEILKSHLFGGHVGDYMRLLQEEDSEKYQKQFSKYIAAGVGPDDLEDLYKKVHEAIRADPKHVSTAKPKPAEQKHFGRRKMSYSQRRDRVRQIKESHGIV